MSVTRPAQDSPFPPSGPSEVSPVITTAKLRATTAKELAAMAKQNGVAGWHAMRKEELIKALLRQARAATAKTARKSHSNGNGASSNGTSGSTKSASNHGPVNGGQKHSRRRDASHGSRSTRSRERLSQMRARLTQSKDLALLGDSNGKQTGGYTKDRLVVMVRDPYWLHAYWELTRQTIERARVAPWGSTGTLPGPCCGCPKSAATARPTPSARCSATSNPRRRKQLVRRRPGPPEELPVGHRLPRPGRQVPLPLPKQRGDHAADGFRRRGGRQLDRPWPRTSTASTP